MDISFFPINNRIILSFTSNIINTSSPDYSDVENLSSENIEQYHEEKTSQMIEERGALYYIGQILFYIGFLSLIIFYFKYYRKYLTGEMSLKDISGREDISEEEMQKRIEEKEKKENKIGWIIVIILVLAVI